MSYKGKDITIELSDDFRKAFKILYKKHRSLLHDLNQLIGSLKENPLQGVDLGGGLRKVRMAITSKGKGKSGGSRIITCTLLLDEDGKLFLFTIYDKADKETISDSELRKLRENFEKEIGTK